MGHERGEVTMLVVDKDRRMSRNGRRIGTSEGIVDILVQDGGCYIGQSGGKGKRPGVRHAGNSNLS